MGYVVSVEFFRAVAVFLLIDWLNSARHFASFVSFSFQNIQVSLCSIPLFLVRSYNELKSEASIGSNFFVVPIIWDIGGNVERSEICFRNNCYLAILATFLMHIVSAMSNTKESGRMRRGKIMGEIKIDNKGNQKKIMCIKCVIGIKKIRARTRMLKVLKNFEKERSLSFFIFVCPAKAAFSKMLMYCKPKTNW